MQISQYTAKERNQATLKLKDTELYVILIQREVLQIYFFFPPWNNRIYKLVPAL